MTPELAKKEKKKKKGFTLTLMYNWIFYLNCQRLTLMPLVTWWHVLMKQFLFWGFGYSLQANVYTLYSVTPSQRTITNHNICPQSQRMEELSGWWFFFLCVRLRPDCLLKEGPIMDWFLLILTQIQTLCRKFLPFYVVLLFIL